MPILCYNGKNEALMRRDRKTEVKKMVAIPTLFSDVLMFVLLIIPGFFMGRAGKIADSALGSMTNILMYIAMPFLVFYKLIETDLRTLSPIAVMVCMTAPIAVIALIVGMSSFVFPQHEGDTHWRASRFCAAFANCGFLGIPLASVLFPAYPEVAVYVSLYNVVNTFLLLTVGVYILSGNRRDISIRRALVSPIAGAIMLGLLCAVFDLASVMPRIAIYSGHLASLTTPLSMIVLGVELSKVKPSTLIQTRALYPVALLKLVAAPMHPAAISPGSAPKRLSMLWKCPASALMWAIWKAITKLRKNIRGSPYADTQCKFKRQDYSCYRRSGLYRV